MSLAKLRSHRMCYIGTPYTLFTGGIDAANKEACEITAALIKAGVKCFSPIAHSHAVATLGGINPKDHAVWLEIDEPMMEASDALVIVEMDGFEDSYGVNYELDVFRAAEKPVYYLNPNTLEVRQ